jgi:pimeloyl-ACP methyl ester carboxylesterase
MTITAEAAVAVQAGLAVRPDSVPDIARIRVPVLAIAGGEDAGVTPAEMEAFKAAPGGCEFHVIADAGHFAAYEKPDEVAGMLGAWLARVKGGSADHTLGHFRVRVQH